MKSFNFFPTLSEELFNDAGIECTPYRFSYNEGGVDKSLNYDFDNNEYILLDEDGVWNPRQYNLSISSTIRISNPKILFGTSGIVPNNTKLIIGLQWKSKLSNKRNTIVCGTFDSSEDIEVEMTASMSLKKKQIRGSISLEMVLCVGDSGIIMDDEKFLAHKQGIILGSFNYGKVMLEGKGSEFPVFISSIGENEPLWTLQFNSIDPLVDKFTEDNICICFNSAHCEYINVDIDNLEKTSALFKEIIATAIVSILVELDEMDLLVETRQNTDLLEGSICAAMHYFITVFDIDISSYGNMMSSVRKSIDRIL